jgi:ectoine hydroxylase-related dioxygenase (phytanoyl-CoA dioxygenase family)
MAAKPQRPVLPDAAIVEALDSLGADPETLLSTEERQCLDQRGFVCLGQLLSREQVDEINRRLGRQLREEGASAGSEVHQEEGASRMSNMNNKRSLNWDGLMDTPLTHPKLLAAMRHVLGDHIALSSLNYRQAEPGHGHQSLHTDWGENEGALQEPPTYQVCNSIWFLDDFTELNGRTRVLPGKKFVPTTILPRYHACRCRHPVKFTGWATTLCLQART